MPPSSVIIGHFYDGDRCHLHLVYATIGPSRDRIVAGLKNESCRVIEIHRVLAASLATKFMQALRRAGRYTAKVLSLGEYGKTRPNLFRHFTAVFSFQLQRRIEYLLVLAPPVIDFQSKFKMFPKR